MVFEKIKEMLANQLGIDANLIELNTDLIKDLGADSLDIVDMLMNIEEEWNLTIEDEVIQTFRTLDDVVKYVEKNKK